MSKKLILIFAAVNFLIAMYSISLIEQNRRAFSTFESKKIQADRLTSYRDELQLQIKYDLSPTRVSSYVAKKDMHVPRDDQIIWLEEGGLR
ncbi:MAG: hypothetical protein QM538_06930 [Methylacidiphilales bacterium]|nr:hypothetical protein [Candidatus Methylacidiphilales bacterium]